MKSAPPWYVWAFLTLPEAAVFVLVGFATSWGAAAVIFGLSYGLIAVLALRRQRRRRHST